MNCYVVLTIISLITIYCDFGEAGECKDLNTKCAEWAKKPDECYKNRAYMLQNCPYSCHQCSCGNNNPKCVQWANSGECAKNAEYMKIHCRQACQICKVPASSSFDPEYSPVIPEGCVDWYEWCEEWASKGDCRNNAKFMERAYEQSCKLCKAHYNN